MGFGHQHAPGEHDHASDSNARRRLGIAFTLVFGIVIAQGIGAWITGSLALLVDVIHSVTDSMGLLVALLAATLMMRPATHRRTWGFRRVEVLAALLQAVLLLAVGVYAIAEGVSRLSDPPEVLAGELLWFGIIGLTLNIVAVVVLSAGRRANFNMKAAFLEVLMDALGSVAVVVSAVVMMTTGYAQADTIAAFVIAGLILPRAALLIRDTVRVLMEFTPAGLDLDTVRAHILELDHVKEVHDLHASTVATGLPVLSAHIVLDESCFHDGHSLEILEDVRTCVAEHFEVSIRHSTLQLESTDHCQQEHRSVIHH